MSGRKWARVCSLEEMEPGRGVAALVDGAQVALFLLPGPGGLGAEPASRIRAVDNRDPASGANVLSRGLIGATGDIEYVASPMHKHRYDLATGRCLDGVSPGVRVWPVRVWGNAVEVLSVVEDAPVEGSTPTHCPFCALQCAMRLRTEDGDLVTDAEPLFPVNRGRMCIKGWAASEMIRHPDRLLHPMVRNTRGHLRRASWDAALDELAEKIDGVRTRYGPDAFGVFGSGALTNEKAYLLGKFARVAVGTSNIDYNGRYCMSSAAAAQKRAFGLDRGLPFPVSELAEAGALVLWGANPADTMPPLMQWIAELHRKGGSLIVVDPRRTSTAAVADIHLQPVPGTDLAVALGLVHLAVVEGFTDDRYIESRTTGWEEVKGSVANWAPSLVQSKSGVPARELKAAASAIFNARTSMALTGRGPEQQSKGVDTVSAIINLMLALGQVGRRGGGYGCLTGQANGQGGREHGQRADQLPGYRDITSAADRETVAEVWGIEASAIPARGMSAVEILHAIGQPGGVLGLLVTGSDLLVASPDANRARDRLARLECLGVLDAFPNDTSELAHVVLPVTQWAEEDGTTTNLEGRVIRRRQAVGPPDGVRSDLDVISALAARLGAADKFQYDGPEQVFDELRRATAGGPADYSGITYERLDQGNGIFWPCPDESHPGTTHLFGERFEYPDGRARFVPVEFRASAEEPDEAYPIYFTTGRWREHYNSGTQTRRINRLRSERPAPRVQMNPSLAANLGVADGDYVVVESRRGSARFMCAVDSDIRPDTVFAPFHWNGDRSANLLTIAALDPVSKMPEFKVCAVRVRSG